MTSPHLRCLLCAICIVLGACGSSSSGGDPSADAGDRDTSSGDATADAPVDDASDAGAAEDTVDDTAPAEDAAPDTIDAANDTAEDADDARDVRDVSDTSDGGAEDAADAFDATDATDATDAGDTSDASDTADAADAADTTDTSDAIDAGDADVRDDAGPDAPDDPCGNGTIDPGEACDDGNRVTEEACDWGEETCLACDATCENELELVGGVCGDGITNGPELCDRGDAPVPAVCSYGVPRCDTCNDTCDELLIRTGPFCGDGVVDAGELCDDGADQGAPGTCSPLSCQRDVVRLASPEAFASDEFGRVTAVSDAWLAVGQPFTGSGAILIYQRDGRDWVFDQRLDNIVSAEFSGFGSNLHLVGDELLTSCGDCSGGRGALLVYRHDGRDWSLAQQVSPADAERTTEAGRRIVALTDDVVVLVSEWWDPGDGFGGAWVIERGDDGDWGEPARIAVSLPDVYAQCGAAATDDTIVLASCEYDSRRGGLFVFERGDDGWAESELISTARFPEAWRVENAGLGESIAFLDASTMLLGLPDLERDGDRGAVVELSRADAGWVWVGELPVEREPGNVGSIGGTIAADDDTVVLGLTRNVDGARTAEFTIMRRIDGAWVQGPTRAFSIGSVFQDSLFVALGDGRLAVGSAFDDDDGDDAGAVWLY